MAARRRTRRRTSLPTRTAFATMYGELRGIARRLRRPPRPAAEGPGPDALLEPQDAAASMTGASAVAIMRA